MNKFVYITQNYPHPAIAQYSVGLVTAQQGELWSVQFVCHYKHVVEVPKSWLQEFDPKQVGDAFSYKVCNICHRYLPTNRFDKNQNGKNNRSVRRPSCNECRKMLDGKNMTPQDKQKWEQTKPDLVLFTCPICRKTTIPGLTSKVVLDHDHQTGTPRAWICDSCNTGIGRFKDDISLLQNAIHYLRGKRPSLSSILRSLISFWQF